MLGLNEPHDRDPSGVQWTAALTAMAYQFLRVAHRDNNFDFRLISATQICTPANARELAVASPRGRIILRMPKNILALLEGGDRRSIGRADEVAAAVCNNHALFPTLMRGWRSEDPVVRMRAADATEKITRKQPDLLRIYRRRFWL